MTPLPFPPRRKRSIWRRAGTVWLALPEPARLGILLIALVLIAWFSG